MTEQQGPEYMGTHRQDDDASEQSQPATPDDQDNGQDVEQDDDPGETDGMSYVEERQERYESETTEQSAPVEEQDASDGQERGTDSDVRGTDDNE